MAFGTIFFAANQLLRVVLDPAGQGHKPTVALIATKVIQK
jgi:hypothetical protein